MRLLLDDANRRNRVIIYERLDKNLKPTEIVRIPQSQLSSECWTVQFRGLKACEECEHRDTEDCGGKEIRRTGRNEKGHKVRS